MTDTTPDLGPGPPPVVHDVPSVAHQHGLAWHWDAFIDALRQDCPRCQMIPCWRHVAPNLHLEGFNYSFGAPELGMRCYSGAAGDACTGTGRTTIQRERGGMVASACEPCTVAYLGEELGGDR